MILPARPNTHKKLIVIARKARNLKIRLKRAKNIRRSQQFIQRRKTIPGKYLFRSVTEKLFRRLASVSLNLRHIFSYITPHETIDSRPENCHVTREPAPLDFSLCHPLFIETFWFPHWFRSFAKPWGSRARGLTMPANTYFPVPRFI